MIHTVNPKELGNKIVKKLSQNAASKHYEITRNDEYYFVAKTITRGTRFTFYLNGMILETREVCIRLNDDSEYDYITIDNGAFDLKYLQAESIHFEIGEKTH